MEGRDVATCNLLGYFLEIDIEEFLLLRVNAALALLFVKLNWKRWKNLRCQGKNLVIYASCDKAIYGTVISALLSYKKLIEHLLDWGFEMNPYEPFHHCVPHRQL